MLNYDFRTIEKKWQAIWKERECFRAEDNSPKVKKYNLVEFPYPSGEGLHVGHPRPYTALDVVSRMQRMQGYNVLFPMGWDAFGLPTENYAMKTGIHPAIVTKNNIARFKGQLESLGYSFDWSREVSTTDPNYYKWTQWIFLQLFKKGLAYKKEFPINFCVSCKVGLANEEVVNGVCERCGSEVVRRTKNQWMLKITDYAQRLLDDLDTVDYIERVRLQQTNWIGRSEGADIDFALKDHDDKLTVYTTRPDTIFGATYMVISPEHPFIEKYRDSIQNINEVLAYREQAEKKSDFERTEIVKEKTGVVLKGLCAVNPANEQIIPIYISDYVLMSYGTGAIMAVPGHDQRDWEFATAFGLPIIEVVSGGDITKEAYTDNEKGVLVNSGMLNGLSVPDAVEKATAWFESKGRGKRRVNYKLRDWVFSRQRYWGEPIPLVYCEDCGWVPVDEAELPLLLPHTDNFIPTESGDSPLAKLDEWVNTPCPACGKAARRETDTMPQWAGSSWYFLRYTDPRNADALASEENLRYWTPVDWYNGGMEHTTLHLLYSRFWHKFLYDIGVVPTPEPYARRTSHGMILGENNEKMSKSRGNVVNPDEIVRDFGADTLRTYEMFIGDFEKAAPWSTNGVKGVKRFLDRVFQLQKLVVKGESYSADIESLMHKTIAKVTHDYENLKANTAIAALMSLVNTFYERNRVNHAEIKTFLLLLNPCAPHITEELWQALGFDGYLHEAAWPVYDEEKMLDQIIEIPVQVNGKLRGVVQADRDATAEQIRAVISEVPQIMQYIDGKQVVKEIYVPQKIFTLVVK